MIQELYSKCKEENKENVGELYNGFTPEGYDEWATAVNFTEPYYIIDQCTKSVEEGGMGVSREAVVLDIGSCTGIVGQKLQAAGFTQLHALDVSRAQLDAVRERGFYVDHHELYMGRGVDQFPDALKGRFDIVTASGVFLPGHMPNEALDDCHAALKVGGLIVTAMRMSMWTDGTE